MSDTFWARLSTFWSSMVVSGDDDWEDQVRPVGGRSLSHPSLLPPLVETLDPPPHNHETPPPRYNCPACDYIYDPDGPIQSSYRHPSKLPPPVERTTASADWHPYPCICHKCYPEWLRFD